MGRRRPAVAVLVTAITAVTACSALGGSDAGSPGSGVPGMGIASTAVARPTPGLDGVTVLALAATDRLTLEPGAAALRPGPVRIVVRNTGVMQHEVSLVEPATGRILARGGLVRPGATVTMPVRLTTPGDYEVRCGFHPGMIARLTVE